jgi:coatomer subunit beta'
LNRVIYPPAEEYMIHAERSNENLVEAFKNMHVQEEMVPDDNEEYVHEVC